MRKKREIEAVQAPTLEEFEAKLKRHHQKKEVAGLGGVDPGHCSRKSIIVNFDEIGWTHILAPKEVKEPSILMIMMLKTKLF